LGLLHNQTLQSSLTISGDPVWFVIRQVVGIATFSACVPGIVKLKLTVST